MHIFLFKPETAYELRISDWSSDVCSSDLQHLILLHHAADSGDLRDTRHGLQLVAQKPVLNPAELRQVVAACPVDQRVFIYPADAGRVRPARAAGARRYATPHLIETFEHARSVQRRIRHGWVGSCNPRG